MKTLKLSLIGILFLSTTLFSTNLSAKDTTNYASTPDVRSELVKLIQNPNLKQHGITEADVQIQFTIEENGMINILNVKTGNDYLAAFIKEKLNNKKLTTKNVKEDLVYYLSIKFELV